MIKAFVHYSGAVAVITNTSPHSIRSPSDSIVDVRYCISVTIHCSSASWVTVGY